MSDVRKRVALMGFLSAEGREARCVVYATRIQEPDRRKPTYIDFLIEQVRPQLPDGRYQLKLEGVRVATIAVKCSNGCWGVETA